MEVTVTEPAGEKTSPISVGEKNVVSGFINDASEAMLRSCIRTLHKKNPSLLEKIVGQVVIAQGSNI